MKNLSSVELLSKAKFLVSEERRITLDLIEALREIDRRLLFAELGYGSLFEFVTKHLGLSEGSAQRRIQAMRLTRDIPDAKASLENGELSLSNAAKVQSFFQMEKKHGRPVTTQSKEEVLKKIEGMSQRECEQKLYEISPQSVQRERERVVSATERELKIVISEELYEKIQLLRGLLAHSMPEANYAELLEYMTGVALAQVQKKKGLTAVKEQESFEEKRPAADPTNALISGQTDLNHTAAVQTETRQSEMTRAQGPLLSSEGTSNLPPGVRVHLPNPLQRKVWNRAGAQCEYEHEGRRCTSRFRLEIDHRTPLALGGTHTIENLRLLCRTHNTQQAWQKLG